jgi:hypothetical protein
MMMRALVQPSENHPRKTLFKLFIIGPQSLTLAL